MKYISLKDNNRRKSFFNYEYSAVFNKSLIKNNSYSFLAKQAFFNEKLASHQLKARYSITRIRNRCVLTGRSRSLIRFFRLSRIKFREYASSGRLFGVQKASW